MTERDLETLKSIYGERTLYQGELHDHAKTGGTSDGKRTLEHWKGAMEAQEMDFATILDHKQVRHMYLPEWEDGVFLGGTEPGTLILDNKGEGLGQMHYNMIFSDPKQLESILEEFEEFQFTGGPEGHFKYPKFTRDRFNELITAVKNRGGFFVFPHPTTLDFSKDIEDYWFQDEIGIEVIYIGLKASNFTPPSHALWKELLKRGKRVWACAGGDRHECAHEWALTSIYADERKGASYLKYLRKGDFTSGHVGIQMCIGDTAMGGKCSFKGKRLVIGIGKFHRYVKNPEHKFRMDILNEKDVVYSEEVSCTEPSFYAMNTEDCDFYRVEIYDETSDLLVAVGNPIWNDRTLRSEIEMKRGCEQ